MRKFPTTPGSQIQFARGNGFLFASIVFDGDGYGNGLFYNENEQIQGKAKYHPSFKIDCLIGKNF